MPMLIPVAIGLAAMTIGEIAITATLVMSAAQVGMAAYAVASFAMGRIQQRQAKNAAKKQFNRSQTDRAVTVRSGVLEAGSMYGTALVGGEIVYVESTGSKGEYLHMVVALGVREIDAIEAVYFNGEVLPAENVSTGFVESGNFMPVKKQNAWEIGVSGTTRVLSQVPTRIVSVNLSSGSSIDVVFSSVELIQGTDWTLAGSTITALTFTFSPAINILYEYNTATPSVRIRKKLGAAGQAAYAELVSESAGKWTSAHVGVGVPSVYIRLKYDTDVYGQIGIPDVTFRVRGFKVYDPRGPVTQWSANAALCTADYLKDSLLGAGAASGEVIDSELIAAANVCDEAVNITVSTTQVRYNANGFLSSSQDPRSHLQSLVDAMAGYAVWTGGRWLVRAGAGRSSVMSITTRNFADGTVNVVPKQSRKELFNAVTGVFIDPAQKYAEVEFPSVENATYVTEDGGKRKPMDIELPLCNDPKRAQRLAKIALERGRQGLLVTMQANHSMYDLVVSDWVAVTLSRYGFSAKLFEVIERKWSMQSGLTYVLQEAATGVYAWNYGEATTIDLAPDSNLPSPFTRPAMLTSLTATSGTSELIRMADGTLVSRVLFSWAATTDVFVDSGGQIEIQYSQQGDTQWTQVPSMSGDSTSAHIVAAPDGAAIVIRARAVNSLMRAGEWEYLRHTVIGKSAPPTDVAGLTGAVTPSGVRITWTAPTDIDYDKTELRVGGSNWATASPLIGATNLWVSGSSFVWLAPAVGTYTVRAKHIDTSNNASATAASTSVTITAADLLAWASITGRPAMFRVVSQGYSDVGSSAAASLYNAETGAALYGAVRSYMLIRIRRSDGVITASQTYDVYGAGANTSGRNAATLASDLNATTSASIVVVYGYDEPKNLRLTGGLEAAMYRCGASKAVFGSPQFKANSAYILVGIGGSGEGNGFEAYNGDTDGSTNAWCDVSFYVQSGQFIISGTTAVPRTLADHGYTGALNANRGGIGGYATSDPFLTAPSEWENGNGAAYSGEIGNGWSNSWSSSAAANIYSATFPVDPAATYLMESLVYKTPGTSATHYLLIAFYDRAGALIAADPTWPGIGTFNYWGLIGTSPAADYANYYSIEFGNLATAKIPVNTAYAKVGIYGSYTGTGLWYWGGTRVREIAVAKAAANTAVVSGTTALWSGVTGTGRPASNATVGGTWGTNIYGSTRPEDGANKSYVGTATPPSGAIAIVKDFDNTSKTFLLRSLQAYDAGISVSLDTAGDAILIKSNATEFDHVYLLADYNLSTATLTDVADMNLPVAANSVYVIEGVMIVQTAAITTGVNLQITAPSGATVYCRHQMQVGVTSAETRRGGTASSGVDVANTDYINMMQAVVITAGTAGVAQLQFAAEVAASATLKAYSTLSIRKITNPTPISSMTIVANPGIGASYTSTEGNYGTATATLTLRCNANGTWSVLVGSGDGLTGTPAAGNWGTPTTGGAGTNYEVKFTQGSSSGTYSVSNAAPSYTRLSTNLSFVVTTTVGTAAVAVTMDVRKIGTTSPVSTDTVTLNTDAYIITPPDP